MRILLVLLIISAFLSCGKVVTKAAHIVTPESKSALQAHQWNLDSVVLLQDGKVVNREYIQNPDYKYYQFSGTTYSYWASAGGIKSTHTGNYEYSLPEQIFFWDIGKSKQADGYSTIEVLTDNNLVFFDLDESVPQAVKKISYYFHAE